MLKLAGQNWNFLTRRSKKYNAQKSHCNAFVHVVAKLVQQIKAKVKGDALIRGQKNHPKQIWRLFCWNIFQIHNSVQWRNFTNTNVKLSARKMFKSHKVLDSSRTEIANVGQYFCCKIGPLIFTFHYDSRSSLSFVFLFILQNFCINYQKHKRNEMELKP